MLPLPRPHSMRCLPQVRPDSPHSGLALMFSPNHQQSGGSKSITYHLFQYNCCPGQLKPTGLALLPPIRHRAQTCSHKFIFHRLGFLRGDLLSLSHRKPENSKLEFSNWSTLLQAPVNLPKKKKKKFSRPGNISDPLQQNPQEWYPEKQKCWSCSADFNA